MNNKEIKNWLDSHNVKNYTINNNVVDVDGDVDISEKELKEIPMQFGTVKGYFDCSNNKLTSLEYCPSNVTGDFYCAFNKLTSLLHAPTSIEGYFNCSFNKLTSLLHAPKIVDGSFYCSENNFPTNFTRHIKTSENDYYLVGNNEVTKELWIKKIRNLKIDKLLA